IARLEAAEQLLAGVPQPAADGAGAVAQLDLDEQVAVAVGAELLVGDEVDLLDAVAVSKRLHETTDDGGRGSHGSYLDSVVSCQLSVKTGFGPRGGRQSE